MEILDSNESEIFDEALAANSRSKKTKAGQKELNKKVRKLEISLLNKSLGAGSSSFCFCYFCAKSFSTNSNCKRHIERGAW